MLQSSYLLINGMRYHYYHANLSAGTRPMLLLHGLASNGRIWEKCAPYLADQGFALYALDLRGHGLTDPSENGYDFAAISQDIAVFMQTCDQERPIIVGHSWGAMVALDFAARFAFGPRSPSALILADGGFIQLDDLPGATWESTRQRLTPPRLAGIRVQDFLERISTFNPVWQPDEQDKEIILANFHIDSNERITPHLKFESHMQIVEEMWKFPTYSRFAQVKCPVLALPARILPARSEQEAEFTTRKDASLEKILKTNPQVRVRWMENSVHDFPLQHPAEFAAAVADFYTQAVK